MLEPLIMSKSIFDGLTPEQRTIITEVGTGLEAFALAAAKQDDEDLAGIYAKANVKVVDFTRAALTQWEAIAADTAWRDYAGRNAACAALLKLARDVPA